ncbi:MAG TPA: Rrf2 family transcriptional regulator [Parvibaculum sp.]|mgnify:CR=1 FL=1|uniref:Rrf2 family transcriptional regulator n=1 Tax=Parvibaculum sp. TaxID=2024848 RepID=UPI002CD59431|nr:Rrf2 family transcriptional regulator [Parvibaculum sp.]HMM15458.1 Rrf2 family transcriptional regulator [Parvibaculum sp.]
MRLTTFTDYCLRVLTYVGMKDEKVATIEEVSRHYGISRNHVMKVVLRLSQLGYLATSRGKGGGMRLAMEPAKINIGVLVRQMEDDIILVECFQGDGCTCRIAPACVLRTALHEALDAFLAVLDSYTLADLLQPRAKLAKLLSLPA